MAQLPILKVVVYRRDKSTGKISLIGTTLTNVQDCQIRLGIETIKDVFSFKVPNVMTDEDAFTWNNPTIQKVTAGNTLQIGDYVEISAYQDSADSDTDNNVIIYGEITDFSYSNDERIPMISINGTNITENLLRGFALSTTKVDDLNNTVPVIIKQIISRLNTSNLPVAQRVFAAEDDEYLSFGGVSNITGSFGNVASTKSDSSAFKEVTYTKTWQPVYRIIEDLATVEYTGDEDAGNYMFYIKITPVLPEHVGTLQTNFINELVFKPVTESVVKTLVRGTDYKVDKITKNLDDVTNVLIVKPGTDPEGDGITTYVINESSLAEVGPKYGFWAKPEIATLAKTREKELGEQIGSTFIGFTPDTGQYPWTFQTIFVRDGTYPYTEDSSTPETAADADEFNSVMRDEILKRGKIEAQNIVNTLGEPRFSANITMYVGSNDLVMGNLVALQDKTAGWNSTTANPAYKLRIHDVRHKIDQTGWETSFVLKEDEKVISDRINT